MEAERCRHELLVEQCADCRPARALSVAIDGYDAVNDAEAERLFDDPAERPGPGGWFEARYGGTCVECGDRFEAGDEIRAAGAGEYECADCGGAP